MLWKLASVLEAFRITAEARADLAEIRLYFLEQGGIALARYIIGQLKRTMSNVAEYPGLGHVREDITNAEIKFVTVSSYYIVYDPNTQPVNILRVIHSGRDVESILADNEP